MENKEINPIEIGSTIANIRKSKKLSQKKLGELINISATHISTVENGGSYSLDTLITICNGLDTRIDYVIYGNIRSSKADNLNDLASLCNDDEIDILIALAKIMIGKH